MKISAFALAVVCAGCSTGVVPMDHGTYIISKATPGGSGGQTKAEIYIEANKFCGDKNMDVETITAKSDDARAFSHGSNAELQFRCVPKTN
jgi:hypothetical protein